MKKVKGIKMKGFEKVERNLDKALKELELNTNKGLREVGENVLESADNISPKIPVSDDPNSKGDLRRSRFVVDSRGKVSMGKRPYFKKPEMISDHQAVIDYAYGTIKRYNMAVAFGFTADYSVYTHEMGIAVKPEASPINWTRPGSGPKYFQAAIGRTTDAIKIIAKHNRIEKGKPGFSY